jgi:cyclophilin family peptidyl-prolyl cis-trans isomerase
MYRVIKNFMIQGGGFTQGMSEKSGAPEIENEAKNGLKNTKHNSYSHQYRATIPPKQYQRIFSVKYQLFKIQKDH